MSFADDLQRDIELDVSEVLLADFGIAATYRKQGDGDEVEVLVYVSSNVPKVGPADIGDRYRGSKRSHKDQSVRVMVQAMAVTDTASDAGVGSLYGGVANLEEGDTLSGIPGHKLGRPDVASLTVAILGGVDRTANGGHWIARAAP